MNGLLHLKRWRYAGVVAAYLVATTVRGAAHDFWISPSAFHPKPGALVGLRLLVGQDMIGDPVPREPESIERFIVSQGTAQKPVPGRDGGDPAGIIRVDAPGLLVAGYQSHPRAIDLPPDKFAQYLGEEGLDEIRTLVSNPGRQNRTAHELFVRCAKTLLSSGASSPKDRDSLLGLSLELVAERNPYRAQAGDTLPFRLTYEGKPRANALVIAVNERDPAKRLSARTDRDGRVAFTLPAGGTWLIKAVHMIPAGTGTDADWQSFWASSTFDLPEAHAHPGSR